MNGLTALYNLDSKGGSQLSCLTKIREKTRPISGSWRQRLRNGRPFFPAVLPLLHPDFLRRLLALMNLMRLSLEESRTRGHIRCSVQEIQVQHWPSSIYRLGELSST